MNQSAVIAHPPRFIAQQDIGLIWQYVVFLLVVAALFTRRPDMFLHAQFYAEDGKIWFSQAYNLGWFRALGVPAAGYLQTFPRLIAGLSLLVPLLYAPLVMNVAGILIQALPVTALLSERCRSWGSLPMRMLMAAIYIAIPNSLEIHVVVTNAQWHIVILELLLAFGEAPRSWVGRFFDIVLFTIGSVSGPFSLFMMPLTLFFWWKKRERWTLVLAAIQGCGALLELATILHTGRTGPTTALGANLMLFLRMIGVHIVIGGVSGVQLSALRLPAIVIVLCALFAALVIGYGLLFGGLPLRLIIVFTGLFLVAALRAPAVAVHPNEPLWQTLMHTFGCRYWFYPILTFLWTAVWCVFHGRSRGVRIGGYCVLIPLIFGVVKDWKYPPVQKSDFAQYVQQFEKAPPGQNVVIPIHPDGWTVQLVKHVE